MPQGGGTEGRIDPPGAAVPDAVAPMPPDSSQTENGKPGGTLAPKLLSAPPGIVAEASETVPSSDLQFSYEMAQLRSVMDTLGPLLDSDYVLDPAAEDLPITIHAHDEVPREAISPLVESLLRARGYATVRSHDGHSVRVLPRAPGDDAAPGAGELETHIVVTRHVEAADMADLLERRGTGRACVGVYAPAQALFLTDTAEGVRRMLAFLVAVDTDRVSEAAAETGPEPGVEEWVQLFGSPPEEPAPVPVTPDPSGEGLENETDGGYAQITLNREEFLQELYENYAELVTTIRPEYYRDASGNVVGLTAQNISQVPMAQKLGLQDGDVLQSINNEQIDSEQKVMELFQRYRSASAFRIGILRNGKPMVIAYRLE